MTLHLAFLAWHYKNTAWTNWTILPELSDALLKLSSAPSGIPDDGMHTIERFDILLFDRTMTCNDIDKARKKLFTENNNVQLIPPTMAALEVHVRGWSTKVVMCVVKHCYQHQSCLLHPAGAVSRMTRVCLSRTGRSYPKQPTPAMKLYRASAIRAVWRVASAESSQLNAQLRRCGWWRVLTKLKEPFWKNCYLWFSSGMYVFKYYVLE